MLVGLITVPMTLGYLGQERYGLWMFALSSLSFVCFFDMGLTPTIKNKMAERFANNDQQGWKEYTACGILLGILMLAFGVITAPLLALIDWKVVLGIHEDLAAREVMPLMIVVYLNGILTIALAQVDNIYAATQRIGKVQIYNIVSSLLCLCMIFSAVLLKLGLVFLAVAASSSLLLARLALIVREYSRDKSIMSLPNIGKFTVFLRENVPLSSCFLGIKLSELVLSTFPNIMIVKVLDLHEVSSYGVASRFCLPPLMAIIAVLPVFWPAFTIAWTRGRFAWLRSRLKTALAATVGGFAAFMIFAGKWGPDVVTWWTRGAISADPPLLVALATLMGIQACVYWVSTFLHSVSDFRFELYCHLTSAAILLLFGWGFTRALRTPGLVVCLSAAWAFGCLLPMLFRAHRHLVTGTLKNERIHEKTDVACDAY